MIRFASTVLFLAIVVVGIACQHRTASVQHDTSHFLDTLNLSPIIQGDPSKVSDSSRDPAFFGARPLDLASVKKAASAYPVKFNSGQVLIDNDLAFEAKIRAIRNAKNGEIIRMSYYIFSDDESSSFLAEELLLAAKRGVKVRLMVDLLTNATHFDFFQALMEESEGRIEVRYYGSMTPLILRDIIFLTQPCSTEAPKSPTQCAANKWRALPSGITSHDQMDLYSKMLLTGLVTKSPWLIQTAIIEGQELDLAQFQGSESDKADQEELQKFLKLVYQAQFKDDLLAAIQVRMAYLLYGEKLIPVMNQIFGRIPIKQMSESSFLDWEHITDFHHHKLLLVGNRTFQLGGRNIENSYHLQSNLFSGKYLFDDVDFFGDVSAGGDLIAKSFDQLWERPQLTWTQDKMAKMGAFDIFANQLGLRPYLDKCLKDQKAKDRNQFVACWQEFSQSAQVISDKERYQSVSKKRSEAASRYRNEYLVNRKWNEKEAKQIKLSTPEMSSLAGAYLENVHYNLLTKNQKPVLGAETQRQYLIGPEHELSFGKAIHDIWIKSLENSCYQSKAENRQIEVLLHSAYWIPPANVLRTFAKMMDGSWDCQKVTVKMVTNSFETTDLNIINVYARYMMRAFFEVQQYYSKTPSGSNRGATFEFYETKKQESNPKSLHSKVSIFGDDILIGSANMDVRSYYMDSNNGIFLPKATLLARGYREWLNGDLANNDKFENVTNDYISRAMRIENLKAQDTQMMQALFARFKFFDKMSQKNKSELLKLHLAIAQSIFTTTKMVLSTDYIEVPLSESLTLEMQEKARIQQDKVRYMNRLLQLL